MGSHRTPPWPETFLDKGLKRGICRWCGESIQREDGKGINYRKRWHSECLSIFNVVMFPNAMRRKVHERDRGVCACCNGDFDSGAWRHGGWEADHIVALSVAPRDIQYWQIDNVQTLCKKCHGTKSGEDRKKYNQLRACGELPYDLAMGNPPRDEKPPPRKAPRDSWLHEGV